MQATRRRPTVAHALLALATVLVAVLAVALARSPAVLEELLAAVPVARVTNPVAPDAEAAGRSHLAPPRRPERTDHGRVHAFADEPGALDGLPVPSRAPAREAAIQGTVVDAHSGVPVRTFTVSYHRTADGHEGLRPDPARTLVREAPDGRFSLRELPAGRWSVTVDPGRSGYERTVIHDVAVPGGEDLLFRVGRGAHVEGRLLDALGRAVGGLEIRLEPVPSPGVRAGPATLVATDGEGRFLFTRVTPGAYRLHPSGLPSDGAAIDVASNQRVEQDLRLGATTTLSITVLDVQGTPVEGARLLLAGRSGFRSTETDAAGASRIGGLAPDRFALRVSRDGFQAQDLDLALRRDHLVEIVLAPGGG